MARSLAWLMATEVLACGLDFSFAPCVDLDYGLYIADHPEIVRFTRAPSRWRSWRLPMHGMRDAGMAATAQALSGPRRGRRRLARGATGGSA